MSGALWTELRGERVLLLPERALYWERADTLLVADTHWGKSATFRAAGLPVPGGGTRDDLERLSAALRRTGARRLVVLGDLFHARRGRVPATLEAAGGWRARHPEVEMRLVRGNHDRHAGDPPPELGIAVADPPVVEPPFVLHHEPLPSPGGYTLAGHLHPAVRLVGAGRQREYLPCFLLGASVGVLPAFGGFTGTAEVTPAPGDRVFVVAGGEVVEVR